MNKEALKIGWDVFYTSWCGEEDKETCFKLGVAAYLAALPKQEADPNLKIIEDRFNHFMDTATDEQFHEALNNSVPKQEPSGWRPIESAPKDGNLILLYPSGCWCEDVEPCDAEVGYWNEDCKAWSSAITGAEDYNGPTHWQPLPDPPEGAV